MPDSLGRPTRSDLPDVVMLTVAHRAAAAGLRVTTYLHPWPPKLVVAKVHQLTRRGLLEWGVMPERPWLTDAGRAQLEEQLAELARSVVG